MKLLYDEQDKVYYADAAYQERHIPKEAKMLWNPDKKRWWTNKLEVAIKLAQYAEERIKKDIVNRWNAEATANQMSMATNSDIDIPVPRGLEYLPFQKAGIAYASERSGVLFGDEMGLGKTIQAIGLMNLMGYRRALVICPATIRINWEREMKKWLVDKTIKVGRVNGSGHTPDCDVYIINYEQLKKHATISTVKEGGRKTLKVGWDSFMARQWDIIIIDEAHYVKNPEANRSQLVYTLCDRIKRKAFLTGTPIKNRPIELWPIAREAGMPEAQKFWYYAKRYCDARKDRYGWDFSGASHLDELQRKLRRSIMVRRMKADVLKELPPKRRQVVLLPSDTAALKRLVSHQSKWYEEQQQQQELFESRIKQAREANDEAAVNKLLSELSEFNKVSFETMSRIRHETSVAKMPLVIEHIKNMLDSVDKIVVFAHHRDVVAGIREAFDKQAVSLMGGDRDTDKQAAIDGFQGNPDIRIFVGSIQASGVGITLTAASTVVFAELDWTPSVLTQAEDRCHRIGQAQSVLVQHLVVDGSIDANLAHKIIEKQAVIDKALNVNGQPAQTVKVETVTLEEVNRRVVLEMVKRPELPVSAFSEEERQAIMRGLRILSGQCDGAFQLDDVGFNKLDSQIGKSLASQSNLSERQLELGKRILKKYHRQLPAELYQTIYKEEGVL